MKDLQNRVAMRRCRYELQADIAKSVTKQTCKEERQTEKQNKSLQEGPDALKAETAQKSSF